MIIPSFYPYVGSGYNTKTDSNILKEFLDGTLDSLILPNSIKEIPEHMFDGCNLKHIYCVTNFFIPVDS